MSLGDRGYRAFCCEQNEELVAQVKDLLSTPGIHRHYVRMKLLGVLVTAAEMAGDKPRARALVALKLELARAHDAQYGRRP